jgi:hypothetical protein
MRETTKTVAFHFIFGFRRGAHSAAPFMGAFDGGVISSDDGALLSALRSKAIRLVDPLCRLLQRRTQHRGHRTHV